jgi:hypothetical protein
MSRSLLGLSTGMAPLARLTLALLALALILESQAVSLADSRTPSPRATVNPPAQGMDPLKKRAAELVGTLKEYRASLEDLLILQQKSLATATAERERWRDLFARELVSKRDLEERESAVTIAQQNVADTQRHIILADHAIAEAAATGTLASLSPLAPGGYQRTASLIRFNGQAAWSLRSGTAKLQQFFAARFGRPLPISAFGQTPLHDRMGFDHHDALDVAVHPDSPEGRALMDYLRGAGIPFIASWGAVPGSTSGAHIHVGQPSPRIATRH